MINIFLFFSVIALSVAQLSSNDKKYISSFIQSKRNEKTGLFFDDDRRNFMSISSLLILKEEVERRKICRELDFLADTPNRYNVLINEKLSCGTKFNTDVLKQHALQVNFESIDIDKLYELMSLLKSFNIDIKHLVKPCFEYLNEFKTKNGLFSAEKESNKVSLKRTFTALRLLNLLRKEADSDDFSEVKSSSEYIIQNFLVEIELLYQSMSNDIGLFTEVGINNFELNFSAVEALSEVKELFKEEQSKYIDSLLYGIRNYFLEFKYGYTNIENIYFLLSVFDSLNKWPVLSFEKTSIFYQEEPELSFKIKDLFNQESDHFDIGITIEDKNENEEKKPKQESLELDTKSDDIEDVEEETENSKSSSESESKVKVEINGSEGKLFHNINKEGLFTFHLSIVFKDKNTGFISTIVKTLTVKSTLRFKINFIQYSVKDTQEEQSKGKDIKLIYPNRNLKSLVATQNSIIKIKVKVSILKLF